MGSVAVYLYKHAREIFAWGVLLSAIAWFISQVCNSAAYSRIGSSIAGSLRYFSNLLVDVPNSVTSFKSAVTQSVNRSGFVQLMLYISGFDVLEAMFDFLITNITVIVSLCTVVFTALFGVASFAWALRLTQRWVSAASGGVVGNGKFLD